MFNWLTDRRNSYVLRWHHQPTVTKETLAEHHMFTARLGYWLATLCRSIEVDGYAFTGTAPLDSWPDPHKVALAGLFHDDPELITGDIPSSAKRVLSDAKAVVERWETEAIATLIGEAPDEFKADYKVLMNQSNLTTWEKEIVHYADVLSALAYINDQAERDGSAAIARIHAGIIRNTRALQYPWLVILRERFGDLP